MESAELKARYQLLYGRLAADGRQERLFGTCDKLALDAFCSCAMGNRMPTVYLELPLRGNPRFDLQVCIDRTSLADGFRLPASAPAHLDSLVRWLSAQDDCTGIDLAFDVSAGDIDTPQLIVLMKDGVLSDAEGFFAHAGAADGARRYREAEARMPREWRSWYTGVIPGRPGSPVRLDYFVTRRRTHAYAQDTSLLMRDLRQMGYAFSDSQAAWCKQLLQLPCSLNLQLDALSDGNIGPVLGYNLIEGGLGPRATRERLESGWMRQVLQMAEAWGIADGRWQELTELCQSQLLVRRDKAGTRSGLVTRIKPSFIKIRMTEETLIDAKVYLICTLHEIDPAQLTA